MADVDPQSLSIQSLYSWFADDRLYVNRRYQRKLVWTLEEKQRLVESILRRYPIPAILLAEQTDGRYEIIDGLQRLHSLISFIENSFSTIEGRYFNVVEFPTAKSRSDLDRFEARVAQGAAGQAPLLDRQEVSTYLDYSLSISVMRRASEAEIDDVFARINTYGHRLSDQERRQAGVQDDFSEMVRTVACTLRGDASSDVLPLNEMPSISIDLPMTKHGYLVKAEEVFWVQQGILLSTDLRDSMDEQCIADIAACIVGGSLIERSKKALDEVYTVGSEASKRTSLSLDAYGADRFSDEIKFCIDEILKIVSASGQKKLRGLIFKQHTTNAFPAVFAVIVIAVHRILIDDGRKISDYGHAAKALSNLADRIETTRRATVIAEREKNVAAIKGLLEPATVKTDISGRVYGQVTSADVDAIIRRSEIEHASYELKQGILTLAPVNRGVDDEILAKISRTVSAIANNGPRSAGTLLIGVADKESAVQRVREIDVVEPRKVGRRWVVGVRREADALGKSVEEYFALIKEGLRTRGLEEPLRSSVLSAASYVEYFGLGVVVLEIPQQAAISFVDDRLYYREGDDTMEATDARRVQAVTGRFAPPHS